MKRFGDLKLKEFFERLEGPEGCDFKAEKIEKGERRKGDHKAIKWKCAGRNDKSLSEKILDSMGVDPITKRDFLSWCHRMGGHCDCEIIFNVKEGALRHEEKEKLK